MSSEYVPELIKFVPTSEFLPRPRVCVILPILLFAIDHIYMFGEVVIDEFVGHPCRFLAPQVFDSGP